MSARTPTQASSLTLNMGPHFSAAIGPLRLNVETDGEMVLWGRPEVGFLHRGIERIAQQMTWTGFMPYTDRIDYLSSIHCNLAYALAVEALSQIAVPKRADGIRVIVSELNRVGSHLLSIGYLSAVLGMNTGMMYALRDREKINNLFEMLSGARLTYSYVRIGGVAADVTEGFIEKTYEFLEYLGPKLKEYNDLLSNNSIFIGRLGGVGVISSPVAIDCGVSGPALRASGVKSDARKATPYCGYHNFDFDVPIGTGRFGSPGDAFDRYFIRVKEIEQAISIVKQALDNLPEGQVNTPLPRLFKVPKGEAYAAVESPRGTFGVYIASSGEKTPSRVRFRTPSFAMLNLFPEILINVPLSDVATIVSSLDIMVSEVDR